MPTIAVVGLGYVGLPVAAALAAHFPTIGFDVCESVVRRCRAGDDPSGQLTAGELEQAEGLRLTTDAAALAEASVIIVAVPTPVDEARRPDLSALVAASATVGRAMRPGTTVVYESTVYPGATEEVCVPALEAASGLTWRRDFHVAYSPERINPGDRVHRLQTIVKLVAGDTPETTESVAGIYECVVESGVHRCSSIRVAEAAKVIENTQRDLNIALVNELAIIFERMEIDTGEVLEAARTKWNFLDFRPGLVGGHCIGVDPYYLTHKAEMLGYHPDVILAGRRINDSMAKFVAERTVKMLLRGGRGLAESRLAVLGLTFKENTGDLRNSQVATLVRELGAYGLEVLVHDPVASAEEAKEEYGITLVDWDRLPQLDALVLAVPHRVLVADGGERVLGRLREGALVVDIKSALPAQDVRARGLRLWRL